MTIPTPVVFGDEPPKKYCRHEVDDEVPQPTDCEEHEEAVRSVGHPRDCLHASTDAGVPPHADCERDEEVVTSETVVTQSAQRASRSALNHRGRNVPRRSRRRLELARRTMKTRCSVTRRSRIVNAANAAEEQELETYGHVEDIVWGGPAELQSEEDRRGIG